MQNNYNNTQLLSTTSTRYTVGDNNTPPKTTKTTKLTMAKKNKQLRKSTSPKHKRPPDPQVVERSPSDHDRAIAINQQHIKNKRNNARSIMEYTQPSPKLSQLQPEESDLHLDELAIDDDTSGVAPNTEGWRQPFNQYNQKEATTELKRKEAQMSQEIEGEVRRNLDTNSFAALSSQDYDSSSSHSSATKSKNEYLLRSLMITKTRYLAFNLMTILCRKRW